MSSSISVEKSKPSRVKRLRFLPRMAFYLDFGGREITFRQASILEAFYNLRGKPFSLKNLLEISFKQLQEIRLKEMEPIVFAGGKVGAKKRKVRR